jgi:photosystem II stability/assembly factor-like uncharacterized protein
MGRRRRSFAVREPAPGSTARATRRNLRVVLQRRARSIRVLNEIALAVALLGGGASAGCKVYPIPDYYPTTCVGTGATTGAGGTPSIEYPTGTWGNVTSNLAGLESECGYFQAVAAKPDEDRLLVGVAQHGLYESRNGGESWEPIGQGEGSAQVVNRVTRFVFDPADPNTWWESGIYNAPAVVVTHDNGDTFEALGDLTTSDVVSVDFSDPDRKLLLAGGHEAARALFKSTDGGQTWEDTAQGLPEDLQCTIPHILDADNYLVGCMAPRGAILRSRDAGATWTEIEDYQGGGGSAPLVASDGSIWWSSPVFNAPGVGLSQDGGETWKSVTAQGFSTPGTPIELPDGRIAVLGKDGAVQATSDHGETWKPITSKLEVKDRDWLGVEYSKDRNALFVWRFTCGEAPVAVHEESIMRYDLDQDAN